MLPTRSTCKAAINTRPLTAAGVVEISETLRANMRL
jgi:hypothetical protein